MRVTLLGTGDTTGTPTVACDCDTCAAARERGVERSRFSVHVENERTGEALLIDASPDFRQQFLARDVALPDAVVVSHIHFDHIDGLGNAYRLFGRPYGDAAVPVHAADETDPNTGLSVAGTVEEKFDYLDAIAVRPESPFDPFSACGLEVTLLPVDHPPLVCYGLRIEDPETGATLSLSGDTSYGIPDRSWEALAGADLLLADGIVPARFCEHHPLGGTDVRDGVPYTFGTKHMTFEGARALADGLAVDDYRLVHVSHFPTPEEAFGGDLAVDGEQFVL
jgi:phosphoribosyl 1,2-cyclic phosphate phosphodiesterase